VFGRSFFLIALLILGVACGGGSPPTNNNNNNNNNNPVTVQTPKPVATTDPTLAAQLDFNTNVWPFFQNNRCEYCHNFDVEHTTFYPGHPTSGCTGCHGNGDPPPASNILGFATPPWQQAPDADKWTKLADPFALRAHD